MAGRQDGVPHVPPGAAAHLKQQEGDAMLLFIRPSILMMDCAQGVVTSVAAAAMAEQSNFCLQSLQSCAASSQLLGVYASLPHDLLEA